MRRIVQHRNAASELLCLPAQTAYRLENRSFGDIFWEPTAAVRSLNEVRVDEFLASLGSEFLPELDRKVWVLGRRTPAEIHSR